MDTLYPDSEIVGIVYLEPNKISKAKRLFMAYMMVMQFFFTVLGLALFGYWLGGKINPDSSLQLILTGLGLGVGVIFGFIVLIQFVRSEERYERNARH